MLRECRFLPTQAMDRRCRFLGEAILRATTSHCANMRNRNIPKKENNIPLWEFGTDLDFAEPDAFLSFGVDPCAHDGIDDGA